MNVCPFRLPQNQVTMRRNVEALILNCDPKEDCLRAAIAFFSITSSVSTSPGSPQVCRSIRVHKIISFPLRKRESTSVVIAQKRRSSGVRNLREAIVPSSNCGVSYGTLKCPCERKAAGRSEERPAEKLGKVQPSPTK